MCSHPEQVPQGSPPQVDPPVRVHTLVGTIYVKLLLPCREASVWKGSRGLFSRGGAGEEHLTLQEMAENIRERRYRRVVVMAGAGISTPSGIPDFR